MQNKRQKFVQLAEKRTQAALNEIRKLGNLSNTRAYEYGDDDIKKIRKALRDAVTEMEARFSSHNDEKTDVFKL